jgi:lipoprotein-releasing system permease protein
VSQFGQITPRGRGGKHNAKDGAMYKLLLALRYLRTRWIALASIISVTLGVATMIVVNAVMAGFAHEMQTRIKGFLADLVVEAHSLDGFPDADWHIEQIRRVAGNDIAGMAATVQVPGMLSSPIHGQWVTRQVNIIGIDERTYADVSDFGKFLLHPENRRRLSFLLRDGGYDAGETDRDGVSRVREELKTAGWPWRRLNAHRQPWSGDAPRDRQPPPQSSESPRSSTAPAEPAGNAADPILIDGGVNTPFSGRWAPETDHKSAVFDPAKEQHAGVVLGIALGSFRARDVDGKVKDGFLLRPGDDVQLTFPTAGTPPKGMTDVFTVVDFYESKMFEYDSTCVFVPMRKFQELRGMIDPTSGISYASTIRIKLREGADGNTVRDRLRAATIGGRPLFPAALYSIGTWRDKQGPLLAAVEMETATLNILLFMIIAVAGFGILATFFMIVVEKTRDIGILKSLGASASGVAGIFVSYGLSLGCVGAGAGLAIGLAFVRYINEIRRGLEWLTGREVFDPTIYYFQHIPTIVSPLTAACVLIGAVGIAVLASVMPALRAAWLHPVEALRT